MSCLRVPRSCLSRRARCILLEHSADCGSSDYEATATRPIQVRIPTCYILSNATHIPHRLEHRTLTLRDLAFQYGEHYCCRSSNCSTPRWIPIESVHRPSRFILQPTLLPTSVPGTRCYAEEVQLPRSQVVLSNDQCSSSRNPCISCGVRVPTNVLHLDSVRALQGTSSENMESRFIIDQIS
jgi:hypothetical protein